eukprot:PhF_6_TR42363/c0_g1_i2/m.63912
MNSHAESHRRALSLLSVANIANHFVCPLDICVTIQGLYMHYLDINKATVVKEIKHPELLWPLSTCVFQDHFLLVADLKGSCVHVLDIHRDYELVGKIPNIEAACFVAAMGPYIAVGTEGDMLVYEVEDTVHCASFKLLQTYSGSPDYERGGVAFLDVNTILMIGYDLRVCSVTTHSNLALDVKWNANPSPYDIHPCDACPHPCCPGLLILTNFSESNLFVFSIEQRQVIATIEVTAEIRQQCAALQVQYLSFCGIACVSSNQVAVVSMAWSQLLVLEWPASNTTNQVYPTSMVLTDWRAGAGLRILEHGGRLYFSKKDKSIIVLE